MPDLNQLRAERKAIMASWPFAFAMAHGCSMGYMPIESRAVLQRYRDLNALISEWEG